MLTKIKQYLNKRKCSKRGHQWYCDRTSNNGTIATKFYHWICLSCPKEFITELRSWDLVQLKNPQDELNLAIPKEIK